MKNNNEEIAAKLQKELAEANRVHNKAMKNLPPGLSSFEDLERVMAITGDPVAELSRKYRMVQPYTLSILDKYGELMSMKDFISCCKSGGFIDYDGYGKYVKDGKATDITIYPSDVEHKSVRKDFTEIIWFNR